MLLVEYPYVIVRFGCTLCRRRGQMRLARLAEKYGADTSMLTVLNNVAWSCPLPRRGSEHAKPQKYAARCGAFFPDLEGGGPPPDIPPVALRVIKSDAAE
ncbi:MAG: hypothetical protein K0S00_1263 [Xanthobacteraceae bacterium]|nr:hypothetical protein [Xanthobacteraceae bacterium]